MPTIWGRNVSRLEAEAHWGPMYQTMQTECGATLTIASFGDQRNSGMVNATTFTGTKVNASGQSPVWTPSEALSAFTVPFDLTLGGPTGNWRGLIPALTLNGTDEEMDTPDAAGWSTAGAFSRWAWIYLNTLASNVIIAKWDETTGAEDREWILEVDSNGDIGARVYDETNNGAVGRKQETALVAKQLYFVGMSFDGGTDAAGLSIMVNGVLTDDADIVDDAAFANAVDGATVVSIGYSESTAGAKQNYFDGILLGGPLGPGGCGAELTAAQWANIWRHGRLLAGV